MRETDDERTSLDVVVVFLDSQGVVLVTNQPASQNNNNNNKNHPIFALDPKREWNSISQVDGKASPPPSHHEDADDGGGVEERG